MLTSRAGSDFACSGAARSAASVSATPTSPVSRRKEGGQPWVPVRTSKHPSGVETENSQEWLLEEAASHAAQTSWARMGYRRPSEARALILQWYRRRMGITVVRAMARHRWRHSQYVGLTRVQLEHSRRRADREHQRQAREQAERRSVGGGSEDGAGALTTSLPWRPEW